MKPNIQRLWDAVNTFQMETRQATKQSPNTWTRLFTDARDKFKRECEALGIADQFDWTDENE